MIYSTVPSKITLYNKLKIILGKKANWIAQYIYAKIDIIDQLDILHEVVSRDG